MGETTRSLALAGLLFAAVLDGAKTSTIRWRERRVAPGPLRYVDEATGRSVLVAVSRCTDMPLGDVAAFLGKADLWPEEMMLAGMWTHYPEITLDDIVQVIEHGPPTAPPVAP